MTFFVGMQVPLVVLPFSSCQKLMKELLVIPVAAAPSLDKLQKKFLGSYCILQLLQNSLRNPFCVIHFYLFLFYFVVFNGKEIKSNVYLQISFFRHFSTVWNKHVRFWTFCHYSDAFLWSFNTNSQQFCTSSKYSIYQIITQNLIYPIHPLYSIHLYPIHLIYPYTYMHLSIIPNNYNYVINYI